MRVDFIEKANGPANLVCEAEFYFEPQDGALDGMKLVGISLWRGQDGDVFVTFPARAFGEGSERRFFDFLRSADGVPATGRRLKAWVIDAYRSQVVAA